MPTMKQVDAMIAKLADNFDFSEREARLFLDLPAVIALPKRPANPPVKKEKEVKSSPSSTPRGPSTYNLFVKAESTKVKAQLVKLSSTGKLEKGAVMKELGARWKTMTSAQKAKYAN